MTKDLSGNIWVSSQYNGQIFEYNGSGYVGTLTNPNGYYGGLAFDSSGYLWVSDPGTGDIYQINTSTGAILNTIASVSGVATTTLSSPQALYYSSR